MQNRPITWWLTDEEETVMREAELALRAALRKRDEALDAVRTTLFLYAEPEDIEVRSGDVRAPSDSCPRGENGEVQEWDVVELRDLIALGYPLVAEALVREATAK